MQFKKQGPALSVTELQPGLSSALPPPTHLLPHTCHLVHRSLLVVLDMRGEEPNSVVEVTSVGFRDPLLGSIGLIEPLHVAQSSGVWLQPRDPTLPITQNLEERGKEARSVPLIYRLQQGPRLSLRFPFSTGCNLSLSPRSQRAKATGKTQPGKAAKP